MPSNYRIIMIGRYLAKLYVQILESELSLWAEKHGCRSAGQAGFQKGFTTLDRILTLQALIEERRNHNKRNYCFFVDFSNAFNIVPHVQLMQQLEALGVPIDMQWGIYALYESASGMVQSPNGLWEAVACTIGVKQQSPLSPTTFGLSIDEVSHYIERFRSSGACQLVQPFKYYYMLMILCSSPKLRTTMTCKCLKSIQYRQRFLSQHRSN